MPRNSCPLPSHAERGYGYQALLALVVVGIVAVSTWSDVVGYSSTLLPSHDLQTASTVSSAYSLGRLVISILFVCLPLLFERSAGWLMLVEGIALLFATGGIALVYSQPNDAAEFVSLLTAFLGGVGGTLLTTPLFLLIARYATPRQAACCVCASLLGESALSVALTLLTTSVVQTAVCCIAPLVGCLCFALARKGLSGDGESSNPLPSQGLYGPPITTPFGTVLLLGELTLAIVAAALLRSLGSMGAWGVQRTNYLGITPDTWSVLFEIFLIVTLVTFLFFVLPRKSTNQARCLMALLVCVASLQVIVLAGDGEAPGALEAIPSSAQLICRMLQWMIFLECANRLVLSPYRTHGIASIFNAVISLALVAAQRVGVSSTLICMGFMYLALAVMVTLTVYLMNNSDASDGTGGNGAAGSIAGVGVGTGGIRGASAAMSAVQSLSVETELGIERICKAHGISKREEDVLRMLVAGLSRSKIESALELSEGTVRTHMNNIYRKCGVHSRGDLVEMVEASRASEG